MDYEKLLAENGFEVVGDENRRVFASNLTPDVEYEDIENVIKELVDYDDKLKNNNKYMDLLTVLENYSKEASDIITPVKHIIEQNDEGEFEKTIGDANFQNIDKEKLAVIRQRFNQIEYIIAPKLKEEQLKRAEANKIKELSRYRKAKYQRENCENLSELWKLQVEEREAKKCYEEANELYDKTKLEYDNVAIEIKKHMNNDSNFITEYKKELFRIINDLDDAFKDIPLSDTNKAIIQNGLRNISKKIGMYGINDSQDFKKYQELSAKYGISKIPGFTRNKVEPIKPLEKTVYKEKPFRLQPDYVYYNKADNNLEFGEKFKVLDAKVVDGELLYQVEGVDELLSSENFVLDSKDLNKSPTTNRNVKHIPRIKENLLSKFYKNNFGYIDNDAESLYRNIKLGLIAGGTLAAVAMLPALSVTLLGTGASIILMEKLSVKIASSHPLVNMNNLIQTVKNKFEQTNQLILKNSDNEERKEEKLIELTEEELNQEVIEPDQEVIEPDPETKEEEKLVAQDAIILEDDIEQALPSKKIDPNSEEAIKTADTYFSKLKAEQDAKDMIEKKGKGLI